MLGLALGWQVITPLPDTLQSLGDPSTERSYYEPLDGWLAGRGAERDRIEVVYTFNHWETATCRRGSRSPEDGCASSTVSATASSTRAA